MTLFLHIKNKKTVHTFDFLLYNIFMKKIMVYGNNMKGNNGMGSRIYVCIDLKSFYASVECVERGLDTMTTNLVVADPDRSEKTICLAVSPAMKALGVKNRCRVFEIPKGIDYIMAQPRMQLYIDYSAKIYGIYLKYISKEDIHVYSIDEVFMDVTEYLSLYGMTAKELGIRIMQDIFDTVGIRATCGIGTNLYLAKIALDITAKHAKDFIGELDEESYKRTLWHHRPITDFWRVGHGLAGRLAQAGIYDMAQIAEADEQILYDMIGIDAELLIDHAWGIEPVTIADIKKYKPRSSSITSGQVLARDYEHEEGRLIVKEMADGMCLQLVEQGMVTDSVTIYINYSKEYSAAAGVPQSVRGSIMLPSATSSSKKMLPFISKLYDEVKDKNIPVRKINLIFNRLTDETYRQVGLFDDDTDGDRENKLQHAVLDLKKKYGRDAVLKGMNLEKGATAIERNHQIGGHRSGN